MKPGKNTLIYKKCKLHFIYNIYITYIGNDIQNKQYSNGAENLSNTLFATMIVTVNKTL